MNRKPIILILLLAFVLSCFAAWTGDLLSGNRTVPVDQLEESVDYHGEGVEGERSGKWRSVRNAFVAAHPVCEACGSDDDLNVHHIKPFHESPELELEWDNLVTLCRKHHFTIGHDPDGLDGPKLPNWKLSNPNVLEDSRDYRDSLELAP